MVAQRIVSNDDLIEQYHQQGVVFLASAIKPSLLHTLADLFASCLEQPTPLAHQHSDHRKRLNQGNYHDSFLHVCFEELMHSIHEWEGLPLISQAMHSHQLGLFNIELVIKSTNNQSTVPWHPSIEHWPVKGQQLATLWLPLDPIDSQSGGVCFNDQSWQCQPGDAILFDARTNHCEHGNHCHDFERRILLIHFYGDHTCYHPKPFSIPMLWAPKLKPGDPLHKDPSLFPLLSISLH